METWKESPKEGELAPTIVDMEPFLLPHTPAPDTAYFRAGCPTFWCLCTTLKRRAVLGHTLNTLRHVVTKISHNVLNKLTNLCWAALTAIPGCVWPVGCGLDTPWANSISCLSIGKFDIGSLLDEYLPPIYYYYPQRYPRHFFNIIRSQLSCQLSQKYLLIVGVFDSGSNLFLFKRC